MKTCPHHRSLRRSTALALAVSIAALLAQACSTTLHAAGLIASDGAAGDYFGVAVSPSDSIGLIGAYFDQIGGNSQQGAAYVFRSLDTATSGVTENAKLIASDGAATDEFGFRVGLDGDQSVVGARSKNSRIGKARAAASPP